MKRKPLISIIVPIYKVEAYLNKCITSIVEQTYKNMEIILVDDGSPDHCPEMCDEWAKKDTRIIVIHQRNAGLSAARNSGLSKCKGEYVLYIDSDDWIRNNMVERLVEVSLNKKADIVATSYSFANGENSKSFRLSGEILQGSGCEMLAIVLEKWLWQSWGKLIRYDIAQKALFVPGLLYEDYENTPRVFLRASKIVFLMEGLYVYRVREDSIMGQRRAIPDLVITDIDKNNLHIVESISCDQLLKDRMHASIIRNIADRYRKTLRADNCEKKARFLETVRKLLKSEKNKWKYNKQIKLKDKLICWSICYIPFVFNCVYSSAKKIKERIIIPQWFQ